MRPVDTNRPMWLLRFLYPCTCCPQELMHHFGLWDATPPLHTRTHPDADLTKSTLSLLFDFPSILPHKPTTMDSLKRVASGGLWDRLPEEVISLIASKVADTS
jgi:hypothetical protein